MIIQKRHTQVFNHIYSNVLLSNNGNTDKTWQPKYKDGSIIEAGENTLIPRFVEAIDSAKNMICLQSFLIRATPVFDAIIQAQQRGVKVFITTSDAHLKDSIKEEDDHSRPAYEKLLKEHVQGKMLLRFASDFHAKFILIDPMTNHAKGFLTTANFNRALSTNPELAVELTELQITQLYEVFVYQFWECATHEQSYNKVSAPITLRRKLPIPKTNDIVFLSKNHTQLKDKVIEMITNAKTQIVIATYGFEIDYEVGKLLLEKLKYDIEVIVFTPERQKAIVGNIEQLVQAGAKVFIQPKFHAKLLLCDKKQGCILSANFDKEGLEGGFETGVILSEQQVEELQQILEYWQQSFATILIKEIAISKAPNTIKLFKNTNLIELTIQQETKSPKPIKITAPTIAKFKSALQRSVPKNTAIYHTDFEVKLEELKVDEDFDFVEEDIIKDVNVIKTKTKQAKQKLLVQKDFNIDALLKLPRKYHSFPMYVL